MPRSERKTILLYTPFQFPDDEDREGFRDVSLLNILPPNAPVSLLVGENFI